MRVSMPRLDIPPELISRDGTVDARALRDMLERWQAELTALVTSVERAIDSAV